VASAGGRRQVGGTLARNARFSSSNESSYGARTVARECRYDRPGELYHKAIVKLGQAAKKRGVKLRQTYVRVAKRAAIKAGRYAHAKQFKRSGFKLERKTM
jgi:hypothetical protein